MLLVFEDGKVMGYVCVSFRRVRMVFFFAHIIPVGGLTLVLKAIAMVYLSPFDMVHS